MRLRPADRRRDGDRDGNTSHERPWDVADLTSRLAADADDHAAQVAFAIESIADEVAQLMCELAALRTAVNEQLVLLDELRALQR